MCSKAVVGEPLAVDHQSHNLLAWLVEVSVQMLVEALVAQETVEARDKAILHRFL